MSSRHEGVSCDACLKGNFRGRRYKCLICYDYDLCAACYEAGATNTRHTTDHPMQCILTRADFEVYYGGEALTSLEMPQSYTCPYCARMGFTETTLQEHVTSDHADTSYEVVCPLCAAMPGGEPNLMTDDFAGHLTLEHRSGSRDLISFLDEGIGTRHGVRRMPHGGHSGTHIGRGAATLRPRRSNMHFSYPRELFPEGPLAPVAMFDIRGNYRVPNRSLLEAFNNFSLSDDMDVSRDVPQRWVEDIIDSDEDYVNPLPLEINVEPAEGLWNLEEISPQIIVENNQEWDQQVGLDAALESPLSNGDIVLDLVPLLNAPTLPEGQSPPQVDVDFVVDVPPREGPEYIYILPVSTDSDDSSENDLPIEEVVLRRLERQNPEFVRSPGLITPLTNAERISFGLDVVVGHGMPRPSYRRGQPFHPYRRSVSSEESVSQRSGPDYRAVNIKNCPEKKEEELLPIMQKTCITTELRDRNEKTLNVILKPLNVFSSGGLSSLSPSSRESVDPIAELLSQLSGVRRSGSNAGNSPSQLQQLQMQLQLERQQVNVARQQLERFPRRQTSVSQTSGREQHASSTSSTSTLMLNSSPVLVQPTNNSSNATSPSSQFLLASLLEELSSQTTPESTRQDRSQFVQELVLSTSAYALKTYEEGVENPPDPALANFKAKLMELVSSTVVSETEEDEPDLTSSSSRQSSGVLRGRARSDSLNAKRRAEANRLNEKNSKDSPDKDGQA